MCIYHALARTRISYRVIWNTGIAVSRMVVSMCAMDESSSIDDSDYENSTGTLNRGETENNSPKIDSPPFLSNCQRLRY